jgi:hypothetical protein
MKRLVPFIVLCLALGACKFNMKPSFPAETIAADLRLMCQKDYKLTVEARHQGTSLQAFFWTVGLMTAGQGDLSPKAAESLERVLLCATRIALSTDAALKFVEVRMADVLTGATITVWRYVPDIHDSMRSRFGDEEYMNRLVLEVTAEPEHLSDPQNAQFQPPLTLAQFLAKQVVLRAKRQSPVGLQAHEDLSTPQMLTVVIDNWPLIEQEGPESRQTVENLVQKAARQVLSGYRFKEFQGVVMKDAGGAPLGRWAL